MMRMSKKRISALLMALTLAVVMIFSGCTSDDNSATTETVKSTATTEKTTAGFHEPPRHNRKYQRIWPF